MTQASDTRGPAPGQPRVVHQDGVIGLFTALDRLGTWRLVKFAVAIVAFLLLHLMRIPLCLAARVLEHALQRIDRYVARQAPPPGPVNHFYPATVPTEERCNVYA